MEQQMIANGGVQFVPQIAVPQIVYLDFDGELTDYNGEALTVDNVNVSASGYDQKSISLIINQLNDIYSGDLFFTDIKPEGGEYSTVYIGKSNFLTEYTSIHGISETIDAGNKVKNDNAFVFLDSSSDIGYTTHVIAHEIGHIVYGDTHSGQQHNPYNQTTAYQYYSVVGNINSKNDVSVKAENTGIKSLPLVIDPALKEYCYVMQLLADMTKLYGEYYDLVYKQQYYQQIYAYEKLAYENNNPRANAVVKNWQVAGGTRQILTNGATASLCYILGVQSVSFDGSANQCAAMNSGSIQLWGGTATNNYISGRNASLEIMRDDGYASNTVIDGGTMQIQLFGGSALNTVVKNGGKIDIVYNLGAHAYLFDTYIDSGCTLAVRHLFDEINGQTTTTHQIRLRGTTYLAGEMIFSSYTQPGKTDVDFSTLSFRRVGYRVENCGDFIFGADSRTPYDDVMVSNMNSIGNTSDYDFTTGEWVSGNFSVAVAADMQSGQYRLAGNAGDYYENHRIYILDVDTGEKYFHTYGSQLQLGNKTFSVQLNSSDELCLTVKDVEANPDLEITDLTVSSTDITAGTPLTLKFSLKNSGNYEAATSVVGIYDGSQLLYRINAIALPIRTSQLFTHVVDTGKMTGGTHNLRIIADIDNDVNESNEKNNETNISVQVRTKAQQADLVIDDFTVSTSSITAKENVTLNFTVKNVGTLSAPNSIVGIYDGSNYLGSVNVSAIDAGASKSYTYTISADKLTKGEHNLIVEADKDNLIAELDETNNRKSTTVQVTAPSNVDLVPYKFADYDDVIVVSTKTGTHKDASTITTEDKIYIDWGVINQGEDSIDDDFYTALYLDDKFVTKWVTGELWSNYCIYIHDYELGTLSAGEHTLKIVTDYSNAVAETSESNNAYTKTFTVLPFQKCGVEIYSSSILTSQGDQLNNALISGANNYMYISSGGVASNTQISEYGSAVVYSGGTANNTTVNNYGSMYISSGGVANSTTVNSGGAMIISSGGVANDTTVNSWGDMYISSGGVANSTTVNYGGIMMISIGGVASNTIVNFGMTVTGGTANGTTVNSGADIYISSGGVANRTTVNSGADIYISSSGVANSTTVSSGGGMYITSGGVHSGSLQIGSGAVVLAHSGSVIDFTVSGRSTADGYLINNLSMISRDPTYTVTVADTQQCGTYKLAQGAENFNGTVTVGNGSTDYGTLTVNGSALSYDGKSYSLVQSSGNLTLNIASSASVAANVKIYSSGTLTSQGSSIAGAVLSSGGNDSMHVSSGGVANSTTVNNYGGMYISSGGVANSTTVNSGGTMIISSGGVANGTTVNSWGDMYISSGGSANNISAGYYAGIDIYGNVNGIFTSKAGFFNVYSGGKVSSAVISHGHVYASSGGYVYNATIKNYGTLSVEQGGSAVTATIESNGRLRIESGAYLNNVNVLSGGNINGFQVKSSVAMNTTDGSFTLNNVVINSSWYGDVYKNQTINNVTVSFGGCIQLRGGTLKNVSLHSGGKLAVYSNSVLTGINSFAGNVNMSSTLIASGATINFAVDQLNTTDGYIIDNLSLISGAPTYTITVSASQANGTYKLAQGASSFTGTLAIGNGSTNYGSITVNGSEFVYGGKSYSLDQAGGNLTLTIGSGGITPPAKPVASANITTLTNTDVIVTAIFSSDTTVKQYSLNNSNWYTYTSGIAMSANGSVYFRGQDAAGNISEVTTYTVNNIDKTLPTVNNVSLSQGASNYTFTATVSASDNKTAAANLKYQIKYATTQSGLTTATATSGKSFTLDNTAAGKTYYYQIGVTDEAGNTTWSDVKNTVVKDVTAPTLNGTPTATVNGQSVTFSWSAASDNLAVKGYYLTVDGNKYTVTGTSYTLSNLAVGSHSFTLSAYDAAGNESSKSTGKSFTIAELKDTVKPTISSVSISQGSSNYTFTATVTASDNKTAAANLSYQIKYATSQSGLSTATATSGKSFTLANTAAGKTYYYQIGVTDEAGNTTWSDVKNTVVKDVTAPTLNGTPTATVNGQSVTFSWSAASDNLAVKGYYLTVDGNKYTVTGTSCTLSNLAVGSHNFTLSAYDAAGNESSKSTSKSFTITAPEPETIGSTFKWSGTEYVYIQENGVTKSDFEWTTADNGESAYMWTNKNIIDAEKDSETMNNYYLYMNTCWAATASNMFVRAGWSEGVFSTEDITLKYFCDNLTLVTYDNGAKGVSGGWAENGCSWLISGYKNSDWTQSVNQNLSTPKNKQSGGFYKESVETNSEKYVSTSDAFTYNDLMLAMNKLQDGYAVGLGLYWCVFDIYGNLCDVSGGHAITVYGFTYDESKKDTPGYFTGILVSDSDDDYYYYPGYGNTKYLQGTSASTYSNRVKKLELVYDERNNFYIFDSYGFGMLDSCHFQAGVMVDFQFLTQKPDNVNSALKSGIGFAKNADWNAAYSVSISEADALNGNQDNKRITAADDIYVAVKLSNSGLGNSGSFTITAVIDEDAANALTFTISKVLAYGESDDQTVVNLGKLTHGIHDIELTVTDGDITNTINISNLYVAYANMSDNKFTVNAGQMNNGSNISADQSLIVMGNGSATGTVITANGEQIVKANGSAEQTKIYANGMLTVENGGTANKAEVFENGFLIANGSVNDTIVHAGGALFADQNSKVQGTIIEAEGWMDINYQGSAEDTDVYGNLMVTNGTAENTTVFSGGILMVVDNGVSENAIVKNNAKQYVADGGNASNNSFSGAQSEQYVFAEGSIATGNTFDGAAQIVASGGIVNDNTFNNGAVQDLSEGATAVSNVLKNESIQYIWKSVAYNTTVNSGCMAFVFEGGISVDCTVKAGGYIVVGDMNGEYERGVGSVKNLTVENGGYALLEDGAVLFGTTIIAGSLAISGKVTGDTMSMQDASPSISFDFSQRSVNDGYMVSNISLIGDVSYSVVWDVDQNNGIYKWSANGGADFEGTISIYDNSGTYYGSLSGSDMVLMGDQIVTLENSNGSLNLVVADSPYGAFEIPEKQVYSDGNSCSWGYIADSESYIVQFSRDNFQTVITVELSENAISFNNLPFDLQWRIKARESGIWTNGQTVKGNNETGNNYVLAAKDWEFDMIFASVDSQWKKGYSAQHLGFVDGWEGTGEKVSLVGKNVIADIFEGSSDANVLVLTDDSNGDVLFVDDIYTVLPGTVAQQQSRIAKINEIRAGAGDDIIDMTSMQFSYVGNGVKIYGGLGDDTIWANNGTNILFGDAGNDRIVGGSDDDVIVGGIGIDRLHGGGGQDIFCFGGDWGKDSVEQLANGKVTLFFESGSLDNWNEESLIYTDGDNQVVVTGVSKENIEIVFADKLAAGDLQIYRELGVFEEFASEKIFEDSNKGTLA